MLLATPYFTDGVRIFTAVQAGRSVRLIVGLNSATSPFELEKLHHLRAPEQRRAIVIESGQAWRDAEQSRVPDDYLDWLGRVDAAFGSAERIAGLSPEEIANGLTALHAFAEQLRFTKGGLSNLPAAFWAANGGDAARVRRTLGHLLYGDGDFIERLHDALYSPRYKLGLFGRFCALELFGTVHPERCPPMNGRMAKALRFIGFDVPGG